MIKLTYPIVTLALITACSNDSAKAPAPPARKEGAIDDATAAPEAKTTPTAQSKITIDNEGLRIVTGASARAVPFGSDQAMVIATVEKLRGPAKLDDGKECGAGPVQFAHFGGFSLLFQESKFGGWALQPEEAGGIGMANGITIGSTRAALDKAFPTAKIDPESTLGTEFYTGGNEEGGISGLLDGAGPQAKVTNLWSGLNCVFR